MNRREFWEIIATARQRNETAIREVITTSLKKQYPDLGVDTPIFEDELESRLNIELLWTLGILETLLVEELKKRPVADIIAFDQIFQQLLDESFTYNTCAACAILDFHAVEGEDYVSQDSFIYFRAWLIGQGSATFERVVANVETLVDILPADIPQSPSGEKLLYIGGDAYEAVTDDDLMPSAGGYNNQGIARDIPVPDTEDLDFLKRRYPRLTRHFIKSRGALLN